MNYHQQDRYDNWKLHQSPRGYFSRELYRLMAADERIHLISADLGWQVLNPHFEDFPERCLNTGASEQCAAGICVGLALEGKVPIFYSITSFLLCRGFEWLRNYLQHEEIAVHLVGSGLDDDYKKDGHTHHSFDAKAILALFPAINCLYPQVKEDVPEMLQASLAYPGPTFLCLRR